MFELVTQSEYRICVPFTESVKLEIVMVWRKKVISLADRTFREFVEERRAKKP
ncbi:hypothetical protein [Endozoicomonas sp. 8E]|uniref:hypothetical protein n=1 Tax=Endozoicomonas sp. 8E TaxID=3035692 RepID=UPI00293933E7|nr:hypothetical protein [Endozoicomonas sp. 8E]WOG26000.1 hypothetical protein P6910_15630 [Endozoicomonas sp. 8E]